MTPQFPYGLADFQKIREEGYFYIDRTDRISLIESAGDQLLFLRPRRFGKSLWLSVLENYYDLARADQFEALFGDLKIGREPTPKHNRYFILRLDFSEVDPNGNLEAITASFHRHINSCIRGFSRYYHHHLPQPIERDMTDSFVSLRDLIDVTAATGHKLYLLIDEYDNFANEVMASQIRGIDRYQELVGGEGIIKTFFKVVKASAGGRGLDRVFITGVSPVVLSDITSGYNVAKTITHLDEYHDLCGFTGEELDDILTRVLEGCLEEWQDPERRGEVLSMLRTFYNGYRFARKEGGALVYNPALTLYFFDHFSRYQCYPEEMLDENLAMDRNRIRFVAGLPHGEAVVNQALDLVQPLVTRRLADDFGIDALLKDEQGPGFLVSLLYYLGVLTRMGRDPFGELQFAIPNLVVRKLYVERMRDGFLSTFEHIKARDEVSKTFYITGELEPLCDFIEARLLKVFDNRDLRWSNELVVKTLFLVALFNDSAYIVDSETAIDRGYCDLSLILRPDMRKYRLLDHLLEFKHLRWEDLGAKNMGMRELPREELRQLPPVAKKLSEAETQLADYRETLERVYGEKLRLATHAVVCIGLERLVWG
uniref:PD-(D/E)XK nuclease superfamily protein n=1 Tax=Candidatus Kentrum sp. MB TaxID=2138164 RepID=A0A451BFJ8_9GAMM|nr:MAG: PD-(D/E)XK nuclease superfamily protein [Candidatus Kentron sp. MB]VFK34918.1 MAG: PD-(D/E)XK nuclease superfamily protein [Candidatus Kentron sp. MB]VFK77037.1 MAG: PD-(D/E)XK nuclease superfamily protein [Candidatus Kentron sp. MB]